MPQALWTPKAEVHLAEIAHYVAIEDFRPATAEKIVRELREKCGLYAGSPLLGEERPEFDGPYRSFPYKRWVVIYWPLDDGIVVEAVFDATRDYVVLFRANQ